MTWTPERHNEVKARCQKATEGPWVLDNEAPLCPVVFTMADCAAGGEVAEYLVARGYIQAADKYPRGDNRPAESMEFIAAARTDLPDALAEIERLQTENEALRAIARTAGNLHSTLFLVEKRGERLLSALNHYEAIRDPEAES